MKTIILIIIYVAAINKISYPQSGWIQQSSGVSKNLTSIYFINSTTGWASGDSGVVIKTTNGGTNWTVQNSTTALPLLSIMFADENTGWAAGGFDDGNPLCYHNIIVIKTTNGGTAWTQQINGIGFLYNDLFVVNNQTAYITSSGICCPPFCIVEAGGIGKTSNSGLNWVGSLDRPSHSVFFLNANTGWGASRISSDVPPLRNYIFKTINAGNNWEVMFSDSMNYSPFRNIFFTDAMTGYALRSILLKTTNSGVNWQGADSINTNYISSHFFINKDTGWCCGGGGKMIRTNNGGTNWIYQSAGTSGSLRSVYFINAYTGWSAGNGGIVIKTVTGGLTSAVQISNNENSLNLEQNYPNPFNPKTIINFQIPMFSFVSLKIYNTLGKEVAISVKERKSPGKYEVEFDGSNLPSGVYFYRLAVSSSNPLTSPEFMETKRMLLIK